MGVQKDKIEEFLRQVDASFPVPLSIKQDLSLFANKLCEKATLCFHRDGDEIAAMVAGYTDNVIENKAYISIVATKEQYRGRGYAAACIKEFIQICEEKGLDGVHLYTDASNLPAICMYQKNGFVEYLIENETRPEDIHLIYWI